MRFCLMLRLVGSMISGLEMEQVGLLVLFAREILSSCASCGFGWMVMMDSIGARSP
jgi:hypothetical protein